MDTFLGFGTFPHLERICFWKYFICLHHIINISYWLMEFENLDLQKRRYPAKYRKGSWYPASPGGFGEHYKCQCLPSTPDESEGPTAPLDGRVRRQRVSPPWSSTQSETHHEVSLPKSCKLFRMGVSLKPNIPWCFSHVANNHCYFVLPIPMNES